MSARPGFPVLTDSDRYSLMLLLTKVRVRRASFRKLVDENTSISKQTQSDYRVLFAREYRSLEHMILVQFPECADTWPFVDAPKHETFCWFARRLKDIDRDLAFSLELPPLAVQVFYKRCGAEA